MSRVFKFKAWNKEEQLLVRLNAIDCKKGVLFKKNHILLQYTGLHDKNEAEVYEYDILLFNSDKYLILWDENELCWSKIAEHQVDNKIRIYKEEISKCVKLCNYYESPHFFMIK